MKYVKGEGGELGAYIRVSIWLSAEEIAEFKRLAQRHGESSWQEFVAQNAEYGVLEAIYDPALPCDS